MLGWTIEKIFLKEPVISSEGRFGNDGRYPAGIILQGCTMWQNFEICAIVLFVIWTV